MLLLRLLGPVAVFRDGAPATPQMKKPLALLLLLARSAAPLPRTRVAALLWPTLDEADGRRNLRRELARLRELGLGDGVSSEGPDRDLATTIDSDARQFESTLGAGRPDDALALWRGPPADGFSLGDADAFDDWLARERTHLLAARRKALLASAVAHEAAGNTAAALERVEALLADDPLQEQHHRDAMRLLLASGRREAALAQYERCRQLLQAELDLAPMAETEALAARLRAGPDTPRGSPATTTRSAPRAATGAAPATPSHRPVLLPHRLPFIGRADEVARLEVAWAAATTLVIEGEAGVGKTRLAADFAAAHGPFALARCRPGDGDVPYASFTRALRALMGPAPALPELPEWAGRELARLLPELGPAPPPMRLDDERGRFFEACARAWQALAAESFDAVVLDDWHLADGASRALVAFIAQRRAEAGGAGVREVLLLRPDLDAAAAASLRSLVAATGALRLDLRPLPEAAVLELVQQLSGAIRPLRFAERLQRATGGNPFYVAETLRHLAETALLSSDADGAWHTPFDEATSDYRELPMPPGVLDTVLARVQRLPSASQRVLEAAALAAEPFAPSLLAPACALSELDAVLAIEAAVAAELLHEHDGGGFAFAHDLVQQALSGSLSTQRRRLVHRRLALGAEAAGAPAATVAGHHESSGEPGRAVAFRIAAGDQALRLNALAEAMAHWSRALADGPTATEELRLRERLLRVAPHRAELDVVRAQAEALGALAAASTLTPAERVDAAIGRGLALARGDGTAAIAALADLDAAADESQRGALLRARCTALMTLGRVEDALTLAQEALALPALSDADRTELHDLAFINANDAGRAEAALGHAEAALALARRTGDEHGVARARFRRGLLLLQLHDVAAAEVEMQAAVEGARRLGFVNMERIVLYNLNCLRSSESRHPEALATLQQGWALQPPLPPGPLRIMYATSTADAHFALGDLGAASGQAAAAATEAMAQAEPTIRIAVAMSVLEPLGLVGEVELARRLLASFSIEEARNMRRAAEEMWVARAQFELRHGDLEAAAEALAEVATGELIVARAGRRLAQARAELALARGDASQALAWLPADDALGMNGEMQRRGLALRVTAETQRGELSASTLATATAMLARPSPHAVATLELGAALARAARAGLPGVPAASIAAHAELVATLAGTLDAESAQQAAFLRAWGR